MTIHPKNDADAPTRVYNAPGETPSAMTIHPIQQDAAPYDSVWAQEEVPVQEQTDLERVMLAEDKLYVVLAVVLIIWIGLTFLVFRTDRKIDRLERRVEERIPENTPGG